MNFIFAILFAFPFAVMANEVVPVNNLGDSLDFVINNKKNVSAEKKVSPNMVIENFNSNDQKFDLQASVAPAFVENKLRGGSVNGYLPYKVGTRFQGNFSFRPKNSDLGYFLDYKYLTVKFSGLTSLSPSVFELQRQSVNAGIDVQINNSSFYFRAGLWYLDQDVEKTSPFNILSSYQAIGPSLGMTINSKLNETFGLGGHLMSYIPFSLEEEKSSSGRRKSTFLLSLNSTLSFYISNVSSFFLGAEIEYERSAFDGSGDGGLQNSTRRMISWTIPIGFRMEL